MTRRKIQPNNSNLAYTYVDVFQCSIENEISSNRTINKRLVEDRSKRCGLLTYQLTDSYFMGAIVAEFCNVIDAQSALNFVNEWGLPTEFEPEIDAIRHPPRHINLDHVLSMAASVRFLRNCLQSLKSDEIEYSWFSVYKEHYSEMGGRRHVSLLEIEIDFVKSTLGGPNFRGILKSVPNNLIPHSLTGYSNHVTVVDPRDWKRNKIDCCKGILKEILSAYITDMMATIRPMLIVTGVLRDNSDQKVVRTYHIPNKWAAMAQWLSLEITGASIGGYCNNLKCQSVLERERSSKKYCSAKCRVHCNRNPGDQRR